MERLDTLGEVRYILTGHNDVVLDGQGTYLDNLMAATQKVVDEGEDAMTPPCARSTALTGIWKTPGR